MIARFLEKIALAILDIVAPEKPTPPPPPKPEEKPDPREIAAEMRALAGWLHRQADRLDPLVPPPMSVPKVELPPRWNVFLDEDGESGGCVKRRNDPARPQPVAPGSCGESDILDATDEEIAEVAEKLASKF